MGGCSATVDLFRSATIENQSGSLAVNKGAGHPSPTGGQGPKYPFEALVNKESYKRWVIHVASCFCRRDASKHMHGDLQNHGQNLTYDHSHVTSNDLKRSFLYQSMRLDEINSLRPSEVLYLFNIKSCREKRLWRYMISNGPKKRSSGQNVCRSSRVE